MTNRTTEEIARGLTEASCSVCDSNEYLQESHGQGGLNNACLPCFYIWLDGIGPCARAEHRDQTPHVHGEDIRAFCLKAKAEGVWPFDGHQLPLAVRSHLESHKP